MGLLRDAGETISATQSGGVGFLQQSGAKSLSDVVITPTKKKTATKTIEIKKPTLSENIKKSISSGLKMIPGQVKLAGGIMLTSMKQQSERVAQFFTSRYSPLKADPLVKFAGKSIEVGSGIAQKIAPTEAKRGERVLQEVSGVIDRGITSAGKATEAEAVGLREQGQKEMMKVQKEYAEGYIPTEGLGRYLEMAAFNLPQLATTFALTAATEFVTKNPAAATAVGLSTSYGLGATEVYSQARADGLTDNEALPLAQIGGAIIGAIDFLPVGKLLRKAGIGKEVQRQVTKSFVRKVSSAIVSIGSQAGFEGITEGLQEVVGNIAQATYKENQDMLEGVKEAIFVGTLLGGFTDVTLQTVMSATGQKDTDRFVAEIEEKLNEALETSLENRTETEQMIVDSLTERVLEPREAIALVTAYNLDSTTPADGKLIIQQALKAQQTGQNIRITPSQDGKGEVKVEIVDRDTSETPDEMWDSLLMSNEAQRIAEEDTKESQKARKELQEMEEGIEEKRGSEEAKAQELDQFTSSETDALDYIRNKLPEPKETVTTREDIERKREVTSRIKPKEVVVPKSKKVRTEGVGKQKIVEPKIVKPEKIPVSRTQLPQGTGKLRASRLEARMKGVIKQATEEQIQELGLSTYNRLNRAETIAKAVKYVTENQTEAVEVLQGKREEPAGIPSTAIYVALTQVAKGDMTLATKLASLEATALGQKISILAELDPNSPIKLLNEIIKIREQVFTRRHKGKTKAQMKKTVVKAIKAEVKASTKADWISFINSIEC